MKVFSLQGCAALFPQRTERRLSLAFRSTSSSCSQIFTLLLHALSVGMLLPRRIQRHLIKKSFEGTRRFISQSVPIGLGKGAKWGELWRGSSEVYSSVWAKVNGGWAALNIEDSLLSCPVRSLIHSCGCEVVCFSGVCVKDCWLTAVEGWILSSRKNDAVCRGIKKASIRSERCSTEILNRKTPSHGGRSY